MPPSPRIGGGRRRRLHGLRESELDHFLRSDIGDENAGDVSLLPEDERGVPAAVDVTLVQPTQSRPLARSVQSALMPVMYPEFEPGTIGLVRPEKPLPETPRSAERLVSQIG